MELPFSAFIAQNILEEKICGRSIYKIVQGVQALFIILTLEVFLTFEENLKYKCDVPLTAYIDFETTAPTDDCPDPENSKMYAVSYVTIFAFHPDLQLNRVIVEQSFGHSREQLWSLNYLTSEQLKFKNLPTLKQLRDCALTVSTKTKKIAIS